MRAFVRAAGRLSIVTNAIALAMLPLLMLLTTADVVGRQLGARPIKGVVEYSAFILVVAVWFAVAETQREDGHIRAELVLDRMSSRVRHLSGVLGGGLGLVVTLLLARGAYDLTRTSWDMGLLSDVARFPQWIPQAAMALGALALAVQLVAVVVGHAAALAGHGPREG